MTSGTRLILGFCLLVVAIPAQLGADVIVYLPPLGMATSSYDYWIYTTASPTEMYGSGTYSAPITLTHEVDNSAAGMATVDFVTWFDLPAGASARALAMAYGPFPESAPYPGAGALVDASFSMYAGLSWKKAPPSAVATVPVILVATGEGTGEGDFYYKAMLSLSQGGWQKTWTALGTGNTYSVSEEQFDLNYDIDLSPGDVYSLHGVASCQASGTGNPVYSVVSSCEVGVDPMFEFDQAAFDLQMGANTFPLDEYLDIKYSDNIGSVPEPSSAMMTGLALAILCVIVLSRRARLVGMSRERPKLR